MPNILDIARFWLWKKNAVMACKTNGGLFGYPMLAYIELELPKIFDEHGYDVAVESAMRKLDDLEAGWNNTWDKIADDVCRAKGFK